MENKGGDEGKGRWQRRTPLIPIGQKKNGPAMGTLTTKSNTQIPIPLNDKEEELQLSETLEHNMVEKRAPNVLYLENVGPLGMEL